jgi:rhodanese-related sulfurtransferase
MNIYTATGQCVGFLSGALKQIGFKNIEKIERQTNGMSIFTKKDETGASYKYFLSITFEGEVKDE